MSMHHFFKPVFYRFEDQSILFKFNIDLELISIPQFTIKREIKTEKDLKKEMQKLDSFMIRIGITYLEEPFQKSKIEIAEGEEQTFFFHVMQVSKIPISDEYTWIKAVDAMENEDIAWWDKNLVIAYFSELLKN